jgi:hypothetical protein
VTSPKKESWNNQNLNRFQSELKNFLSEVQNPTPSPAPTTLARVVNNPVIITGATTNKGKALESAAEHSSTKPSLKRNRKFF